MKSSIAVPNGGVALTECRQAQLWWCCVWMVSLDQRPARVERTVSCRGGTQIVGQRVQVGLRYASQIVTIEVNDTTLRVYDRRNHLITQPPDTRPTVRHEPEGRLGTITHQLNPIRHPSSGTRQNAVIVAVGTALGKYRRRREK